MTTALAIRDDQTTFDVAQRTVLAHMGVENAPEPDLQVFMHICKRSGLDPFARQIHMIGRLSNVQDERGNWVKVTKYTIQTGIDGFRLIGRRAANDRNETISVAAPEWAHDDGTWRPVWSKKWGTPVAARVTIKRNNEPFTAVAIFDEYAQTKRDGTLTQMWAQRPAGQIAKCAEALAWRMAFPQDLSGIYVDEEMHQADNVTRVENPPAQSRQDALVAAADGHPVPVNGDVIDCEIVDDAPPATMQPEKLSPRNRNRLFALFARKGIPEDQQAAAMSRFLGRTVDHRDVLTLDEFARLIEALEARPDVQGGSESHA